MENKTFEIYRDGIQIPVVYDTHTLDDFRHHPFDVMDNTLDRMLVELGEEEKGDTELERRLNLVGDLIRDALESGDEAIVGQCVLWLGVQHPEIWGLDILSGECTYLSDPQSAPLKRVLH